MNNTALARDAVVAPLLGEARAFAAQFLHEGRGRWWGTAGLMLLGGLLEGVGLLLLVPLAGLLVPNGGRAQAMAARLFAAIGAETPLARLAALLATFVLVVVLRAVVLLLRDRRLAVLNLEFVERRRTDLIHTLAAARWQDVAGLRHARVTSAVGSDIQRIAAALHYLLQAAVATVMLTAQLLLTALIVPALALVAVALMAGGAALLVPSLHRARGIGRDMTDEQLRMMHVSGQFLAGLKLAMAQNAQEAFARDFEESARTLTRQQLAFERRQSLARVGVASASALVGAGVLAIGVWLRVPVASLLAVIVVMSRMSGPALQIQQALQQLASLLPAHASLTALLDELRSEGERGAWPDATTAVAMTGPIVLAQVSYAHVDGGGVHTIDATLRPGEIVGVVGVSGAGKTTFVDLLAGLLEPTEGRVTVGGVALNHRNVGSHRERIAYVGQDSFLLHDTIRHNLTLGHAADDAMLWQALARVGADALVRDLPAGLDTVVAERGARLSGGERQRIALARALLRRPALLILDEATNALDIASECAVLASLAALPDRPAIVMVAHRTETLVACERIITLHKGRLIADRTVDA